MHDVKLFITAGGGPAECRIALSKCLEIMNARAELADCACEIETLFEGDAHGPKSAIVSVFGNGAENFAKDFEGTIKFVFQSPLRKNHGRKNWFLGCSRVDLPEEGSSIPKDDDLQFESFRAGGPGGQHQNKTDSAVRVRHLPTGVSVVSRNERSQHQNRREAVRMLSRILASMADDRKAAGKRSVFMLNKDVERGNPVQSFTL